MCITIDVAGDVRHLYSLLAEAICYNIYIEISKIDDQRTERNRILKLNDCDLNLRMDRTHKFVISTYCAFYRVGGPGVECSLFTR